MQPLKQRSPSPRFAFQAPVPSNHLHKLLPFSKLHFRNIIQNPVDNQCGNDRWTRLIRFSVGPGRFGKRCAAFLCDSFSFKCNFTGILLLFLPRRIRSMFSNTGRTTYRKVFFTVAGQRNRFGSLRAFHRHEQLLFTCACCMKCGEARSFGTLYACTSLDIAQTTLLQKCGKSS
jgi:hypothetical protein